MTNKITQQPIKVSLQQRRQLINKWLDQFLPLPTSQNRLYAAMRYSTLNEGKRLRPLLVCAIGESLGGDLNTLSYPACAVEFIHTYSLIHDDLPLMDDDDWRRNKPACHKIFGEAIALLAGDALQSLAFEVLAQDVIATKQRQTMCYLLAQAIGPQGMVGGQSLEYCGLQNESVVDSTTIETIHSLKTGALFVAAIHLGALATGTDANFIEQLTRPAQCLGLAYQIQDDIDDINKSSLNYAAIVGLQKANERKQALCEEAMDLLRNLLASQYSYLHNLLTLMFPQLFDSDISL